MEDVRSPMNAELLSNVRSPAKPDVRSLTKLEILGDV